MCEGEIQNFPEKNGEPQNRLTGSTARYRDIAVYAGIVLELKCSSARVGTGYFELFDANAIGQFIQFNWAGMLWDAAMDMGDLAWDT